MHFRFPRRQLYLFRLVPVKRESHVVIYFVNTDATEYYQELKVAPASAGWTQYSDSFTIPATAKTMTIFHLLSAVGTLTTDDYSLVKYTPQGLGQAMVTLTFDDGWEDNTLTVLPKLATYGFKGTFYFATTYLEASPTSGAVNVSGPAAVAAIYGAATRSDRISNTSVSDDYFGPELTYELTHSKSYLESLVGTGNVTSFATPFGAYNAQFPMQ